MCDSVVSMLVNRDIRQFAERIKSRYRQFYESIFTFGIVQWCYHWITIYIYIYRNGCFIYFTGVFGNPDIFEWHK